MSELLARTRRGREVALRGMLERHRNNLLAGLRYIPKETKKDKLKRLEKSATTDFDKWVLEQYASLSGRIHADTTQEEAKFAVIYHTTLSQAEQANYTTLFYVLYGEHLQL